MIIDRVTRRLLKLEAARDRDRLRSPSFEVIGERNSGTNFATALLRDTLGLPMTDSYGWKHGFPTLMAGHPNTVYVVIVRNAFDWLKSMYGKPWHATEELRALPFADFLRAEWRSTVDHPRHFLLHPEDARVGEVLQWDRHPLEGRAFRNILELRSVKLRAHLSLQHRELPTVVARHEDVVENPAALVAAVARKLGRDVPDQIRAPSGHHGDHMNDWTDRKPFLQQNPAAFSDTDRAFVLAELDLETERLAGYDY